MSTDQGSFSQHIRWGEIVPYGIAERIRNEALSGATMGDFAAREQAFERFSDLGIEQVMPAHAEGVMTAVSILHDHITTTESFKPKDADDLMAISLAQSYTEKLVLDKAQIFAAYVGMDEISDDPEILMDEYDGSLGWACLTQQISGHFFAVRDAIQAGDLEAEDLSAYDPDYLENPRTAAKTFTVLATLADIADRYRRPEEEILADFGGNEQAASMVYEATSLLMQGLACQALPPVVLERTINPSTAATE